MRRHLAVTAALLAASSFAPAAYADAEMDTIECSGTLAPNTLTTPGYRSGVTGSISCTLGHASELGGWFPTGTFSSSVTASIDIQPQAVPNVYYTVANLAFSDEKNYNLHFEDFNTDGYVAMTSPDYDAVSFGHAVYKYHVRVGYLRPACGFCLTDSLVPQTFYFFAEYVYDLPVG